MCVLITKTDKLKACLFLVLLRNLLEKMEHFAVWADVA